MNVRMIAIQAMMMVSITGMGMTAFAQQAHASDVSVEVRSIHASKQGKKFDPQLSALRGKLERGFAGYTNFKQLSVQRVALKNGQKQSVALPNGSKMTLTFYGFAGNLAKMGVGIANRMNTTLRVSKGSTFFQAGMRYNKGILILAIKVL